MGGHCVVIVDEDPVFARRLADELREGGRRVHVLAPRDELPARILSCHADAVFLGAGLRSGAAQVARTLRAVGYRGQLVCLKEPGQVAQPLQGFDGQWDKPFGALPQD